MYICVHCNKEQKDCRCISPFTTPKTLHNFPGQRYNFWADYSVELPGEDVFGPLSNAMSIISRSIRGAFKAPRELFASINWSPTPIEEDAPVPPQYQTTQVVRRMRVSVYSWNCGHCQEEGGQGPYTVEHYPFGMECRHCGQGYTAEQIINDLAYDTDHEWREV